MNITLRSLEPMALEASTKGVGTIWRTIDLTTIARPGQEKATSSVMIVRMFGRRTNERKIRIGSRGR
jgi:hypothetical protein